MIYNQNCAVKTEGIKELQVRRRTVGARKLAIDDLGAGLLSAVMAKNKLSDGVSFHLRAPMPEGARHFLIRNTYLNTNGAPVNPFLEPLALPVHYQP